MPGDATILEGPVTPAPLFAYRAIRSIFFASPDSSPEHHNKENIVPTYASSPTESKMALPASPQVTPSQKRKRNEPIVKGGVILSPTKGILRTPGLATPRAKYLKDMNVKFKSISPEARRADPAVVQNQDPSKTKAQEALEAVRPAKPTNDIAVANRAYKSQSQAPREENGKSTSATSTSALTPAAIEAYMAQTEKEMKRLIRYGKKMREYALQKDVENQELKMMVDELQRENERMRTGGASSSQHNQTNNANPLLDLRPTEEEQPKQTKTHAEYIKSQVISPALRNKNRGHVREEVDRVETTVKSQSRSDTKPQRRSSSATLKPEETTTQKPAELPRVCSAPAAASSTRRPRELLSTASQHADRLASASTAATNNGTLRLPPDRAAAARERLRKRAEARKTSAETGSVQDKTTEQAGELAFKHNMSPEIVKGRDSADGMDEASFDWADL